MSLEAYEHAEDEYEKKMSVGFLPRYWDTKSEHDFLIPLCILKLITSLSKRFAYELFSRKARVLRKAGGLFIMEYVCFL